MTATPQNTQDSAEKPLAPLWIFRILNPVMRTILRSPAHRMLSGMLMLMSYKGSKTGNQYTIPIGYFRWDSNQVISITTARWWANLPKGQKVTLRIKGQEFQAMPTVINQHEQVIATAQEAIQRLSLESTRKMPLGLPTDREPTEADFQAIPKNRTFVVFTLDK